MLFVSETGRGDGRKGGQIVETVWWRDGEEGAEWKSERRVIMYHLSEAFSGIITIH